MKTGECMSCRTKARQAQSSWPFPIERFPWPPESEWQQEQTLRAAINVRLWWHVVPPIRSGGAFTCPIRGHNTAPGVYIIAIRDSPNRWTIRKVGKAGNLRNRLCDSKSHLDGCRAGPALNILGLTDEATYRELLANGHTLFYSYMYSPDTTAGQPPQLVRHEPVATYLEKVIARTLRRGGMTPSHHYDTSRIVDATDNVTVIHLLPPFLLRALRANVQTSETPYPWRGSPGFDVTTNTISLHRGVQSWEAAP
jgi:hypothetical protein